MRSIFDDLYDGKICPWEQFFKTGSPYAKALNAVCKLDSQCKARLQGENLALYNQVLEAQDVLLRLLEREYFQTGIRLGLRMGFEAYGESENFEAATSEQHFDE